MAVVQLRKPKWPVSPASQREALSINLEMGLDMAGCNGFALRLGGCGTACPLVPLDLARLRHCSLRGPSHAVPALYSRVCILEIGRPQLLFPRPTWLLARIRYLRYPTQVCRSGVLKLLYF